MTSVVDLIAEYTSLDPSDIEDYMHLEGDLEIDSITRYEIFTACEAEFELEDIPEEEAKEAKTVGDCKRIVNRYRLSI
jgi:acyl carrier protein